MEEDDRKVFNAANHIIERHLQFTEALKAFADLKGQLDHLVINDEDRQLLKERIASWK